MGEISKNKDVDVKETQHNETENYRKIKPENGNHPDEAKNFIDSLFDEEIDCDEQQKNPHEEVVDGKKYYYDDNGKLYRVNDDLCSNTTYEMNGYKYETDDHGRKIRVEGKVNVNNEGRKPIKSHDTMDVVGKGDQREGDQRGHIIADKLGGSNGMENLVSQDAKINDGDYKKLEKELADAASPPSNKDVRIKVELEYPGDSHRPDAIVVTYCIDGEESIRIFPNEQEEQK